MTELPAPSADGEIYVLTRQASEVMRVAPCTISVWKKKGYLHPVPGSPSRRPVYRWADVVEAEYTARQNAIRTSGTDIQVRRDREVPGGR